MHPGLVAECSALIQPSPQPYHTADATRTSRIREPEYRVMADRTSAGIDLSWLAAGSMGQKNIFVLLSNFMGQGS